MRPHPGVTAALVLVLLVGLLLSMSFFYQEEGTGQYRQSGILTLIITAFLFIFLVFLATAKLWFPHLWKKNSTHDRHKQHTRHHPAMKQRDYRPATKQRRPR